MAPFYGWVQLSQCYRATMRSSLVPRNSWYWYDQPQKDERLSQPWSHLGPLDWESSTLTTRPFKLSNMEKELPYFLYTMHKVHRMHIYVSPIVTSSENTVTLWLIFCDSDATSSSATELNHFHIMYQSISSIEHLSFLFLQTSPFINSISLLFSLFLNAVNAGCHK